MRITIEDLEALKELNDELEENHIETERHLYSQIEGLEVDIRERDSRLKELGEEKTDLDGTVGMFREVVLRLQGEIQNLQALHTQHEQDQTQQQKTQESQAMHSLERKMKSTHVSGVTRRMEMDLLRVEVVELRLRLGIWGGFVPEQWMNGEHTLDASVVPPVGRTQNGHPEVPTTESFPQADEHALQATLFFERLSKKVEVLRGGVGDIWGVGRLLSAGVSSSSGLSLVYHLTMANATLQMSVAPWWMVEILLSQDQRPLVRSNHWWAFANSALGFPPFLPCLHDSHPCSAAPTLPHLLLSALGFTTS